MKKTTAPSEFSSLVNTELRVLMARRGFTQTQLVEASGVSQPVISRTIYNNESVLNTNQLEALAKALGDEPSAVLKRAEKALLQQQYALAAKRSAEPKGEPDPFE